MTVDELYQEIRFGSEGKLFSVVFERRTNSRRNTQVAGDERKMLCRTHMDVYKKGIISDSARDHEDFEHGIITVWSMDAYLKLRQAGTPREIAGFKAWRRIDIMGIRTISLIADEQLDIYYHPHLHHLTNEFRLLHMPQIAQ